MKKALRVISAAVAWLLLLCLFVGCITIVELPPPESDPETTEAPTEATEETTEAPTEAPTEVTEEATESPTEAPTEAPTEVTEETTEPPTEPPTTNGITGEGENSGDPLDRPIKIYIDQGHNPHSFNTGATGNGLREQDVTYAVGIALAELLAADPRFEVRLSRPTPETMLGTSVNNESLQARCDDANTWGADYFISIHANSHDTASAHGIEAYSFSSTGEAYLLGGEIVRTLCEATGFSSRGMKTEDFHVLRNTAMPAVLVEIGFISNPTEAALMASDPALFARGIYHGISTYFQNYRVSEVVSN